MQRYFTGVVQRYPARGSGFAGGGEGVLERFYMVLRRGNSAREDRGVWRKGGRRRWPRQRKISKEKKLHVIVNIKREQKWPGHAKVQNTAPKPKKYMKKMTTAAAAAAVFLLLQISGISAALVSAPPLILQYHHGHLLSGNLTLHLLWYGNFPPSRRAIISDFLLSLSSPAASTTPSAASWWSTTRRYLSSAATLSLGPQLLLPSYPIGRSLPVPALRALAALALPSHASSSDIALVLTAADVAVAGFCSSRCGTHSRLPGGASFIWVGESTAQCPGQCAWPFHQPPYGPQSTPPLVPPSGDVGADGMVINLATLLAGTVTNPDGRGYFQGSPEAPLEAVSACVGIFGSGAYPGFPGKSLVDPITGASYNAHAINGRKFLLPAMWDPNSHQCATLI